MNPLLLFIAASLIWGSTWIVITYQLGAVAPEVSVVYRFALASLLLLGWCVLRGMRLSYGRRDHFFMAAQGLFLFGLNYVLVYESERFLPSGLVAVVFSLIVFGNLIGMRVFFGQAIVPRVLVGALCGVVGVALLFWPELARFEGGTRGATGLILASAGTVAASLGNMIAVRNHRAGLPVQVSSGFGMLYGALLVAAWALMTGVPWRFDWGTAYVVSLAYLTVFGSVVAFVSYLTLVASAGADRAAFVNVAVPLVAIVLSSLLEDYRWTAPALVGLVLCVGGNLLVLLKNLPRVSPIRPPAPGSSRAGP